MKIRSFHHADRHRRVPHAGQAVTDERGDPREAEEVSLSVLHQNIAQAAPLESQIQHSSQIVPVSQSFRELLLEGRNPQTRNGRLRTKQGSLRPEYRDLTLR